MSDLIVACVNVEDFCGRGREYVRKLRAGITKHLPLPHSFVCVTNEPQWIPYGDGIETVPAILELKGWWQKMVLFKPGWLPPGRVLYLDLDTVIVGDMTPLAEYDGPFAMLTDFVRGTPSSAIMAWPDGFGAELWDAYEREGCPQRGGDQDWIAAHYPNPVRLQDVTDGLLASWIHCRKGLPPETVRAVSFWGVQRPHETRADWVKDHWNGA